jgi:uncharacterized protein YndB with AHSA1/START domain
MSATIIPAAINKTLVVRASQARAFKVFTGSIDRWWPKTHHIGASPLMKVVIEPCVGGRWYGLHEDGSESPWGDVLAWEPPTRLMLAWRITGEWRYDPNLLTTIEVRFLHVNGQETRVELQHRDLERLGDSDTAIKTRDSMGGGWGHILECYQQLANAQEY